MNITEPKDIILWLSGFLEGKNRDLTKEETLLIKQKLESCFIKITPYTDITLNNTTQLYTLLENNFQTKQPKTC